MAKDWDKLPNERGAMLDPSARIGKLNMPAGPAGTPLGPLDIARDRTDDDNGDLRARGTKNLGEIRLACHAGFSPRFRLQAVYRALTQVHEIAAEIAK